MEKQISLTYFNIFASKVHLAIVDAEDADVADAAALAGGEQLHVAPPSVKIVAQRDTIFQFEDRAVGFPDGNIDRGARVEHRASRSDVYAAHKVKWLKGYKVI